MMINVVYEKIYNAMQVNRTEIIANEESKNKVNDRVRFTYVSLRVCVSSKNNKHDGPQFVHI